MTRKIIIDTDPGQDDAVAILLALASPELEVLGLTVVAGNVPLSRTVLNARKILELAGRTDVPIYAGCSRPIRRPLITAEHVHGPTGLDGPSLPEPTVAIKEPHAVDFLIDSLRAAEAGEITLVTLGPLTNVALALIKAPDIAAKVKEIVMIFGSFSEAGNITPAADFNNYVDPEASEVVLKSGIPLVMLPMDVTHQCLSTRERLERIRALGNRCAVATAEMLTFSEHFDIEKYGWEGAPLHDPCAIAYLLKPELFAGRLVNVEVETASPLTVGMSVVDWWHVTDRPRNAQFMRSVDVPAFYELLTERLARLP
jgi:purine nucleosidase